MRRSLVFIAVSALSIILSAAAFADTMSATPVSSDLANAVNTVLQQDKPQGWLAIQQADETLSQVSSDVQELVGDSVDQLTHAMGTLGPMASDGNGGAMYFYTVNLNYSIAGTRTADIWFDVGSDGKVVKAEVSAS